MIAKYLFIRVFQRELLIGGVNMKKITMFIALLTILAGCADNVAAYTPSRIKDKYYEIYDITKYHKPQYQYFIFDKDYDVLDYG